MVAHYIASLGTLRNNKLIIQLNHLHYGRNIIAITMLDRQAKTWIQKGIETLTEEMVKYYSLFFTISYYHLSG